MRRKLQNILKDEQAFSLVELIIVIAIMVVLVSMMVPKVTGYIEKANRIRALETARTLVNGVEVGLVDRALVNEERLVKYYYHKDLGRSKPLLAGCITNYMFSRAQKGENYTNPTDLVDFQLAQQVLTAVHSEHGVKNPPLVFKYPNAANGRTIREVCHGTYGTSDAVIFIYAPGGGVYYAQICLKGSYLVTYENGEYDVENVKRNQDRRFAGTEKVSNFNGNQW